MAINFSDLGGGGGATGKTLKGTGTFTLNLADGAHRITSEASYLLNGEVLKPAGEEVVLGPITDVSSPYSTPVISTDDGQVYYSTNNGTSWATATLPNRQYADWCAYGNGKFIAKGTRSGNYITIWYSTDGISWTQATLDATTRTGQMFGIVSHPGGFVAACDSGVFTSSDGINWIWTGGFSVGSPVYEPISGMFFGYNYSSTSYPVYSYDGKNWTNNGTSSAGTTIRTVAVIPGRAYFFYYNGSKYYETADFAAGTLLNGPNIGQTSEQDSFFDGVDSSFVCTTDNPREINRLNPDGSITQFQVSDNVSAMTWSPIDGKFWVSFSYSTKYSQSTQLPVAALVETLSTEIISPD
jgi:hypothetical protein